MPEVGYQEVYLARAFAKAGYEVKVFTSNIVSPSSKKILRSNYQIGLKVDEEYNFSVLRLKSFFHFRSIVLCSGLYNHIKQFQPDAIFIIGLAKLFPVSLFKKKINSKYISIFGENKDYRFREGLVNKTKSMLLDFGFTLFKKKYYKKSITVSDLIVLNVPETEDFFNKLLSPNLLNRFNKIKFNFYLGYDKNEFYFDLVSRNLIRKKLGISVKSIVFISITKVTKNKKIDKIVDHIIDLIEKGYDINYIIVGLLNDKYEMEIRKKIEDSGHSNNFFLFGFKSHNETRNFYCASDLGIWTQAAISIQEAMGTGLKVIIPSKKSLSHVLKEKINGWYFNENELYPTLQNAINSIKYDVNYPDNRKDIAELNSSYLSYDYIAKKLIEKVFGLE